MNEKEKDNLMMFLDGLTELSRRHKIGITGNPVLFIMQDDDIEQNISVIPKVISGLSEGY